MSAMDWSGIRLLDGRVAVVTGAGAGVGQGIAAALAAAGAKVVVAARRGATGEETVALIRGEGGEAASIETDVADRRSVDAMVARTVALYGGLDIVIHNASSGLAGKPWALDAIDDDAWAAQCGVGLDGAFYLARAAFPHLKDTSRGRFILLGSAQGLHGGAMNPAYPAVKNGQRGFTKALAREWGPHGILVNSIAPAAMTPAARIYAERQPEMFRKSLSSFALGRMGEAKDDIGAAAVAMCSDLWRFVTGITVPVDGGYYTAL